MLFISQQLFTSFHDTDMIDFTNILKCSLIDFVCNIDTIGLFIVIL